MINVLIENNDSKPNTYTKVNEFLEEDIIKILLKEKTGLNDYHTLKVLRIIEKLSSMTWNSKAYEEKYHQVHISCTHDGFMVGGSENIEDLAQKIRQIKLEKILNN